jgi:hypothetical protein
MDARGNAVPGDVKRFQCFGHRDDPRPSANGNGRVNQSQSEMDHVGQNGGRI